MATISILLCSRYPSTVFLAIISIVVLPLQRQLWTESSLHVLKESCEIVPFLTHLYSPTSIINIGYRMCVVTPAHHASPSRMDRVLVVSAGITMSPRWIVRALKIGTFLRNRFGRHNRTYTSVDV